MANFFLVFYYSKLFSKIMLHQLLYMCINRLHKYLFLCKYRNKCVCVWQLLFVWHFLDFSLVRPSVSLMLWRWHFTFSVHHTHTHIYRSCRRRIFGWVISLASRLLLFQGKAFTFLAQFFLLLLLIMIPTCLNTYVCMYVLIAQAAPYKFSLLLSKLTTIFDAEKQKEKIKYSKIKFGKIVKNIKAIKYK